MLRTVSCLLLLPCFLGCGGGPNLASVSGVVTLDGNPVKGASVQFQPIATQGIEAGGTGSYATTDDQGRYTLKTVDTDDDGALVGKHQVRISQAIKDPEDDSGAVMSDKIPDWYNRNTTLTFEVPSGGTDQANFKLSSKRPPGQ